MVMGSCAVTFDDVPPTMLVEYRVPEENVFPDYDFTYVDAYLTSK